MTATSSSRMAVIAVLGLALAAFSVLLGYRFAPDLYQTVSLGGFGSVEMVWLGIALILITLIVVWSWNREESRGLFLLASIPMVGGSLSVLLLEGLTRWTAPETSMPFGMVVIFGVSCGLTVWLASEPFCRDSRFVAPAWKGAGVGLAVGLGIYFLGQQIRYVNHLALGFSDLGEIARVMHNSLFNPSELFLRVNPQKPLFYDHFQPGMLPLLVLWAVWPSVNVILLLQVVAVLSCALPIYWIGKRLWEDERAALGLAILWLVYPSTSQFVFNGGYGFRWGNLCLPLYFFAVAFWLEGRRGWALAAVGWAILLKEEAAIPVGMFGLYLAFFDRQRRLGLALAAFSFLYFLAMSSWVIPALAGENTGYLVQNYFWTLGSSKSEILLSPVLKPEIFWGKLLNGHSLYFAALLAGPFLFFPFRKPSLLFIGSLSFVFICLWNMVFAKSICAWYQASLLPVLFWAFTEAQRKEAVSQRQAAVLGALVSSMILTLFVGNSFGSKANLEIREFPDRLPLVEQFHSQIDSHATLVASHRIALQFVNQKYLYLPPQLPEKTDYVLLDMFDNIRTLPDLVWLHGLREFQRRVEAQSDLHLIAAQDNLVLYARTGKPMDARARVERERLPETMQPLSVNLTNGVQVVGVSILPDSTPAPNGLKRLRVQAYCTGQTPVNLELATRCIVNCSVSGVMDRYSSEWQPLGQAIWPPDRWQAGKFYVEEYLVILPNDSGPITDFSFEVYPMPLSPANRSGPPATQRFN